MNYYVYLYTSPSKKHYVGITDNVDRRKGEHKQKEYLIDDTTKFANAIRKYGHENLKHEVLLSGLTLDEAKEKEIEMIKFYDSYINGYNCTPGGEYTGAQKKLSERDVEDIRYMLIHRQDLKMQEIAKVFSVDISCISHIKNDQKRSAYNTHGIIKRQSHCRKGQDQTNAKLTDEQVIQIRKDLMSGISRKIIEKNYSISKSLVQMIATGEAWDHLMEGYEYKKKEINGNAKLTKEMVSKIKYCIYLKIADGKIADRFSISRSTVMQIRKGITWFDVKAKAFDLG